MPPAVVKKKSYLYDTTGIFLKGNPTTKNLSTKVDKFLRLKV